MARSFNGSTQRATISKAYLSAQAGDFFIGLYIRPSALSGSIKGVLVSGVSGNYWQIDYTGSTNTLSFWSVNYTGTNPTTGTGIVLPSNAATAGAFIAYRKRGGEWSKWLNGVKTVINASISFTLPTLSASTEVASALGSFFFNGALAEIAIADVAPPDSWMEELGAGVAADQIIRGSNLLAYWPLRGTNSPERNYVVAADALSLTASPPVAAHPDIVPPMLADTEEAAWVVDLFHPSGTKRGSSTDLAREVDIDVLGAAYPSKLSADLTISDSDPTEQTGGVMQPGQVVLQFVNPSASPWLDRSWEWRQCPVRIRKYDRVSHALVTEFVGVIIDPGDMANEHMVFTCSGADTALLQQPLPRQVIEVGNPASGLVDDTDAVDVRRMDVGKPIPLVFGRAVVAPPFLKEDVTSSPGGGDFLAAWGPVSVSNVWFDNEATPGLEPALVFEAAPGSPTSATTTTFTVTGDQSKVYTPKAPIRQSSDGGTTWKYSTVASYSGGTVTLDDAILPASPTSIGLLQWGGDFAVEKSRYKFVGAATTFLTTLRFPSMANAAPLVELNGALTNPADVIKFLFSDPDQGLGQTCNAASFAQAAADFTAAGLGSAVNGHVGGAGSQREALGAIDELCALRGAIVWKDPETGERMIQVDTAPTISTRTLEFGADLKNDIAEVLSVSRTPLGQTVNTLTLRFMPSGRVRDDKNYHTQDYAYRCSMTVQSGISGVRQTIESQFIRWMPGDAFKVASRVLYYRAKKLQRSDLAIRFRATRSHWRIRRGQVYPFAIPSAGVGAGTNCRIIASEKSLTSAVFTAVGPYNADIYETNIATIGAAVSTPTAEAAPEDAPAYRAPVNLIRNADFSTGLKAQVSSPSASIRILPDWTIDGFTGVSSMSVTADPRAKGGYYLTLITGTISLPIGPQLIASGDLGTFLGMPAVVPSETYLASVYLNANTTGGSIAGWRFGIFWFNSSQVLIGAMEVPASVRKVPGDVNGFGWERYYCTVRSPATARYAAPMIECQESGKTYRLDAVQFEQQGNIFGRPGDWGRSAPYGLRPANMREGDQTILAVGDPEAGALLQQKKGSGYDTGGTTLSGTSTVVGSAGPGLLKGMTGRVTTAISGPAAWQLALDFGGGALTPYLDALPVSANSTFGDDKVVSQPIPLTAAVNIVAIPASGSFSAGKVKVLANVESNTPPTS